MSDIQNMLIFDNEDNSEAFNNEIASYAPSSSHSST
jgi:hypothetical protein